MSPVNSSFEALPFRLSAISSHRRAQDVRRPHEAEGELVVQPGSLAVVDGLEVPQAVLRLFHGVERQRGRVLGRARLVVVSRIFFLQVSGVGQQNAAEIDGGRRRIDRSLESLLDQARDPTGVIEMSVGEDERIDLVGGHRQVLPVALAPFLLSLEEAAVDQHLVAAAAAFVAGGIDEVFRSGDHTGCSQKLDIAQARPRSRARGATDGCSVCSGRMASRGASLAKYPSCGVIPTEGRRGDRAEGPAFCWHHADAGELQVPRLGACLLRACTLLPRNDTSQGGRTRSPGRFHPPTAAADW